MLNIIFDKEEAIVTLEPVYPLEREDFETAVKVIDPFIQAHGTLKGLIIETKSFPYWKDLAALIAHLKFIKGHHKKVKRLAFVTDSIIGEISEHFTSHFVHAEVKHFPYGAHGKARAWILH